MNTKHRRPRASAETIRKREFDRELERINRLYRELNAAIVRLMALEKAMRVSA